MKNKGGSAAILGSEEYQQARALVADIDLTNKDLAKLGVIAGPDMQFIEGLRGGVDPTSFIKDGSAGLDAMERRVKDKYNVKLKALTDYADTAKGGGRQEPTDIAASVVSEQTPVERVAAFTKGDPSVAGDVGAVEKDREMRMAAVETFLKRDKPTPESIDAARRQVMNDNAMPPVTKAALIATLNDALDKANAPDKKAAREGLKRGPGAGFVEQRLIPEDLLFGLPKGNK